MKARISNTQVRHGAMVLILLASLVGCGQSVTGPAADSRNAIEAPNNDVDIATRVSLLNQIESASFEQLRALAACAPVDAGLPEPPVVTASTTLAEIVARTPQIIAFRSAVTGYFATLPLGQVVALTPCVSAALRVTDGSGDTERARVIDEALHGMSISQAIALRDCLGPTVNLPAPPELSPDPTLAEITRLTPALRAYQEAVIEYLGGLTLGEIVALTPCLTKIGVPVS